jgi:hypothetical protein
VCCTSVTAQLTWHASTLACQLSSTWLAKDSGSHGSASPGSRINTPLQAGVMTCARLLVWSHLGVMGGWEVLHEEVCVVVLTL